MESKKKISSDMHAFMRELIREVLEEESLRNWFDEEWVRIDTQGNITGPCGTMKNKKRPSRCLPKAKAQSLSKAERAATARKKKAGKGQFVPNTKKAKVTRETVNPQDGKADLIQQFRKESGIKQCSIYDKRDNCGPAAIDFISWAKSKGIEGLKRINGYFKADIPASSKRDFTREMKQEFLNDGGNWDSDKERFDWISNSKYAEQWKHIPHYWVEDTNGKIYDPVGQQQFIDTGYAKDINPDRYTLTDIVENYADGKVDEAKQVGNLYHYTSAKGLKSILTSNSLNASQENYSGKELHFVSFTRNKNFHKKGQNFNVKTDYRITLDGDKLSNKYKIKPFAYVPGWDYTDNWEYDWLEDEPESVRRDFFNATGEYDEQEERISFKGSNGSIPNIKDYILKVDKVSDLQENYADGKLKVTREDITNLVVGMIYEMSGKGQFVPNTKKARVTSEIVAILESDYEPTNKDLWSRAIAAAKRKFDKYPSAYANAWASKWYKGKGGNWKKKKK